jgi:hypothetical protein
MLYATIADLKCGIIMTEIVILYMVLGRLFALNFFSS